MIELQGSEKQIVWANEIRNTMLKMLEDKIVKVEIDKKSTKNEVIRQKEHFAEAKTVAEGRIAYIKAPKDVKEEILLIKDARWFIAYRNSDSENFVASYFECRETVFADGFKN